jgi:hypothetical protein
MESNPYEMSMGSGRTVVITIQMFIAVAQSMLIPAKRFVP